MCVCEGKREYMCVFVCVCMCFCLHVCEKEIVYLCVSVCVCVCVMGCGLEFIRFNLCFEKKLGILC